MTMIVSIVNQKGGTGKTTTCVNLGAALAQSKKKVLLLDMDQQGSLTYSLGMSDFEFSLDDVLMGEKELSEVVVKKEGMDVVPSDTRLADTELTIIDAEDRESILKSVLTDVKSYDYILIDCPPSLSLLTINALNASDKVLIPMQMEVLSLQGLDLIAETIQKIRDAFNPTLDVIGILPVMVDKRRKLSTEVFNHISENYQFPIFKNQIRTNVRASEAPSFGTSVLAYDPGSNSAKDYKAFAKEFISVSKN